METVTGAETETRVGARWERGRERGRDRGGGRRGDKEKDAAQEIVRYIDIDAM